MEKRDYKKVLISLILGFIGGVPNIHAESRSYNEISDALLGYLTDAYLDQKLSGYVNPMLLAHDRANAVTREISAAYREAQEEQREFTSPASRYQIEIAQELDRAMDQVFWPAQRQLVKRIETATRRELVSGGSTTLTAIDLADDPELQGIFAFAEYKLSHDLFQATMRDEAHVRPEFWGSAEYVDGWRKELAAFKSLRCSILVNGE